jgi:hypothetical protein
MSLLFMAIAKSGAHKVPYRVTRFRELISDYKASWDGTSE